MDLDFDKPITWGTVARVALVWAAEYGMLALIEDAPAVVKVATVICAVGALAALEARDWLRQRQRHLFSYSIGLITVLYAGFLGYATIHAFNKWSTRRGLEAIYVTSGKISPRTMQLDGTTKLFTSKSVAQFSRDVEEWENKSSNWITGHLGEAAYDRFLDASGFTSFSWDHGTPEYNAAMNRLGRDRKNLSIIIESGAYYAD